MTETCSSGCPRPQDDPQSLISLILTQLIMYVTWPWYARQLRKQGFVRTGWMTWELR